MDTLVSSTKTMDVLQDLAKESSHLLRSVTGESATDTADRYSVWGPTYDKDLEGNYRGHIYSADVVAEVVPEDRRSTCRVLDMAAGTGKVGVELALRGFKKLEALEPAGGMLEVLKTTQVYSRIFQEYVGHGNNTVPSDYYDVVVTCGSLVKGHVPKEGVEDFLRAAKPGGFVVIVMRKSYVEKGGDFEDFDDYLSTLEERGLCNKVSRKVFPNYYFNHDGMAYVYKVV
ncbi:methyltransferase-like protein 27 [Oratosquilla oratoria]|uniref:methyltransferase-like protein 27 n=1 Tax=Oratosquilla oratoria TaxID=337810 RepID=UPI003F76E41F